MVLLFIKEFVVKKISKDQMQLFVYVPAAMQHALKESASAATETDYQAAVSTAKAILPHLLDQVARDFTASLSPVWLQRLQTRLARALESAKSGAVSVTEDPEVFYVQGGRPQPYRVDLATKTCECPDCRKGNICKHRIAAYYIKKVLFMTPIEVIEEPPAEKVACAQCGSEIPIDGACLQCQAQPAAVAESHDLVQPDPVADQIFARRPMPESIIYADLYYSDDLPAVPVEIVELDQEQAHVRALPVVGQDGQLQPAFPFASPFPGSLVKWSSTIVPSGQLGNVRVYRSK
jgi:SWIM zinc finger